jgi:hypothetical protein
MSSFDIPNVETIAVNGRTYEGIKTNPRYIDGAVIDSIIRNRVRNSDDYKIAITKLDALMDYFNKKCKNSEPTVTSAKNNSEFSCAELYKHYSTFKKQYEAGKLYGGKSRRKLRYTKYNSKGRITRNRKSRKQKRNGRKA